MLNIFILRTGRIKPPSINGNKIIGLFFLYCKPLSDIGSSISNEQAQLLLGHLIDSSANSFQENIRCLEFYK